MIDQKDENRMQLPTKERVPNRAGVEAAQKVAQQLRGADGRKLLLRLVAHAVLLAGNKTWRSLEGIDGDSSELAKGMAPEDVVQNVIEDALTGKRNWDPSKGDLKPWLKDQIRSEMSHLVESKEHKYERKTLTGVDKVHQAKSTVADQTGAVNPTSIMIEQEEDVEIQRRIDALLEEISDEPDLEEVVMAISDGCEDKPRFLAEELGIEKSEANNRLKRLRRRVKKRGL